jgi:hypothetical protein
LNSSPQDSSSATKIRGGLLPGVTALSAARQSVGSVLLCIVTTIVLGSVLFASLGRNGKWIGASVWTLVFVLVAVAISVGMTRRAKRAAEREIAAGYTTLLDNDLGLERRDSKTGKVRQRASARGRLGKVNGSSLQPIVGGLHSLPLEVNGTNRQLFLRDWVGGIALVIGTIAEIAIVYAAVTSPGLWADSPEFGQIVLFVVEALLAAVMPYFLIGVPFVRSANRSISTLKHGLAAEDVWKITPGEGFSTLANELPTPESLLVSTSWTLYFVVADSGASFWTREKSEFRLVLKVPSSRIRGATRDLSSFGPSYFPGVRLSIEANNGEQVQLRFIPNVSHWIPGPLLSRRIASTVDRLVRR